jgi:hypothetical protein
MATENETKVTESKVAEGGSPPPAETPKPAAQAKPESGGAKAEEKSAKKPESKEEPSRYVVRGDEDIPEDAELVEMPRKKLLKRLDRFHSSQLKERFGTADPDEIAAKLKRLDELEKKEEEGKRAAMSAQEKLEADLKAANDRAEANDRKYKALYEARDYERVDGRMMGYAAEFLDADYCEDAMPGLKRHIRETYDDKELARLNKDEKELGKAIRAYFKQLVERKPKLGKDYEVKPTEKPRAKVNTTARDDRPDSSGKDGRSPAEGKTVKPKQANSMSKSELNAHLREQGIKPY